MPTPSEPARTTAPATRNYEWSARAKEPPRSIFGNFKSESAGPTDTGMAADRNTAPVRSGRVKPTPQAGQGAQPLQSTIDTALARSFLCRFLARAFEDPDLPGWRWLASSATLSALAATTAFLSASGYVGLDRTADALAAALSGASLDQFATASVAAFGHAARGRCPLNEIEYGDLKADPLFQPHRLADLAAFYRAFGLEITEDAAERHDHLSIELEFLSVLAAKEAHALEHQLDEDELTLGRDAQATFLREHLGRWTPAFGRRLASQSPNRVLQCLADLLRSFVEADCRSFGVQQGSVDLFLRPVDETAESACSSCHLQTLPPGALASAPVLE